MRTNVDVDAELLAEAMTATGLSTKRATIEQGLKLLVQLHNQVRALANLKGLGWEDDPDEIREDHSQGPWAG